MRTLTVTGQGSVVAVPDQALVLAAVVHKASRLTDAVAGAEAAFGLAVGVARRHVEAAHVASRGMHVEQPWHEQPEPGFSALHSVAIRCPDLEVAGALVSALVAEVGDSLRIDNVVLTVADDSAARAAARRAAFDDAAARAAELAAHAGASLGQVQSISDAGAAGHPMAARLSFEPGETQVSEQLTVSFELL